MTIPSASYSITMRLRYPNSIGALGEIATAIARAGGDISAIDVVRASGEEMLRDVTVNASDDAHAERVVAEVGRLPEVTVVNYSDRTFLMHLGGKIEVRSKVPLKTRDDLTMAYTPGVARVSLAIHRDPAKFFALTLKGNTVAVVGAGRPGLAGRAELGSARLTSGRCAGRA
jgi:malate dehydrogenase (oxaloacetate-decarboxylating)